ncbi:MAG TPA: NAD(P)-binding protein [Actinomycetes bacterium]|nr:NAD(P)-binding protein [Actinomycetes bacterium]
MVVVGAGAAGCVVAARLAAGGRRVCVVEAGPDLRGDVPADFRDGWDFPRSHEWGSSRCRMSVAGACRCGGARWLAARPG